MAREGVPLIVIQRQLGHSNLGITSVYLQGIDNAEIIDTVHARRAPMVPVSASLDSEEKTRTPAHRAKEHSTRSARRSATVGYWPWSRGLSLMLLPARPLVRVNDSGRVGG